jgi:HSP20 family molecular chaperone IbpA
MVAHIFDYFETVLTHAHTLIRPSYSYTKWGFYKLSEEKKKMYYYYGGKEKKASQVREEVEEGVMPYSFRDIQQDFDRMMKRFERDFEDVWGIPSRMRRGLRWRRGLSMMPFRETTMPSVDIEDQGKDFRLTMDLPGFSKEDVELEVSEDSFTIQAKKRQDKEEKDKNYIRKERRSQNFYRRVLLPEKVRSEDAKASLENGMLEITLPKKEPKDSKKLKIA